MGNYQLRCMHPTCGTSYNNDQFRLTCDREKSHGPSLLRTVYEKRQINPDDNKPGIFKYKDWLPCRDFL